MGNPQESRIDLQEKMCMGKKKGSCSDMRCVSAYATRMELGDLKTGYRFASCLSHVQFNSVL